MQEIKYEDGAETKELFNSFEEALDNTKQKAKKKPIKKLTITAVIPGKKRKNERNQIQRSKDS